MKYFEDISIGERRRIGAHLFTAEEIKRFARAFDPQPFHLDEMQAEKSHFGRLCASGWHTIAIWMKLNIREMQLQENKRQIEGPAPRLGPSPGFDELKWLKPVYAGDTISFESEVIAKKASRSKPEWGLITIRNVGLNQNGEAAISFIGYVFVERRDKTRAQDA
jgi:acyl dehydratase